DRFQADDPLIDFTMATFAAAARRAPLALTSASLLAATLTSAGASTDVMRALAMLRVRLGRGRTVWAAVQEDDATYWELYWYNLGPYRELGLADVLAAMGDLVTVGSWPANVPDVPEVFSFDFDLATLSGSVPIDHVNLYIGNPTSPVPSGLSYRCDDSGISLRNLYHRFDGAEVEAITAQLACSLHVTDLAAVLWEEMWPCDSVHVARKSTRDGVYWGGVSIDQLTAFVARAGGPEGAAAHLAVNRDEMAHLRFDVGLDLRRGSDRPAKVAIYGVL
ncbi:MAG: hypothetical protein KDA37_10010, partial [Planctomycetales bacterium]|nr:hypothetical protein [Planctomycetales bacterium]